MLKIFSGSSNPKLSKLVCSSPSPELGKVDLKVFPSGERYCQYKENIRGSDVFLIQSLSKPVNDYLLELLIMIDAARRASAERITAVIPYFGYSRQDRKDRPRVPISAKLVMGLLEASGVDRILTMDLHSPQIGGFTNLPLDHLTFRPALIHELVNRSVQIDCVVSPDIGSVKRSEEYATSLNKELIVISKHRCSEIKVEMCHFIGNVKGKNVLVIDDLTESAGTLIEASVQCKKRGAKNVYCAVSHGCFTKIGLDRLKNAFNQNIICNLFVSNSVNDNIGSKLNRIDYVDISHLISKAILNIHNNESVSDLFL